MDSAVVFRPGFAVVDVETTGFDPDEQRVVEIGVVVLDEEGHEVSSFSTLVDPRCDPGPTHIHRISAGMLDGAPTFAAIRPYIAEQLSGRVVVGHNVDGFDLAFLAAECRRAGGEEMVPRHVATVDTLSIAQEHMDLEGRAKLVDCCDHFGLTWVDHHSALGDARVTAALFRCMRDKLGDQVLGIPDALQAAVDSVWPGATGAVPVVLTRSTSRGRLRTSRPIPSPGGSATPPTRRMLVRLRRSLSGLLRAILDLVGR